MNEEEKEDLQEIIDEINRDVENAKVAPEGSGNPYSKRYQEYKEEEEHSRDRNWFEKICMKSASLLSIKADKSEREKLAPPLRLLDWDITPGMVISGAVVTGGIAFIGWMMLFALNMVLGLFPTTLMLFSMLGVFGAGAFIYYKPRFAAQNKVIRSSGEMILSILYMVIYMRSSPNLEGAIRFAALNLEGPISQDLKGILWDVEVGNYNRVEDALEDYTKAWKPYNEDYLESLQLLKAAVNEPNSDRREKLFQDSIDRILDGTQEKMKHYAQDLKTPVMILNALGAMLPVLGMIMLPLISVFIGGISELHLMIVFNIMLPGFLWWFMQQILNSRPPTVSSKPVSKDSLPERGQYPMEILGREVSVPSWIFGAIIFLVIGSYGILGYLSTLGVGDSLILLYPNQNVDIASVPSIFVKNGTLSPFPMLMRSVSLTMGLGLGIGVSKYLGNVERRKEEKELQKIEQQFPTALFELGNKISGGTPIELALQEASESASDLEISGLFSEASKNIRSLGMTFEDAIFDEERGALRHYPSQMIRTVMKATLRSSEKGTHMASMAMMTISRYLENVHKTQEHLNDLMEETTTTIQMLAYLLAPVVSGVAVGMSQTIITAMFRLGKSFKQSSTNFNTSGTGTGAGGLPTNISNLQSAIPPEALQIVVGIYLIQLLFILGTFYMKIQHGEDQTYKNIFIGKILISGIILYSITLTIIALLFGGIITSAGA